MDAVALFREEAAELLAEMEQMLLELENDPADAEAVARFFRAIHTIKGSGGMFGFDELSRFAHEVETVFDKARSGQLALGQPIVSLSLEAKDHVARLLSQAQPDEASVLASEALIARLRACQGLAAETPPSTDPAQQAQTVDGAKRFDPSQARTWHIRYHPSPSTFLSGTDPLALMAELEDLGRFWSIFRPQDIPPLEDLQPETAYGWWDMLLITDRGEDAIRDVFIFVEDENCLELAQVFSEPIRGSDVPELLAILEGGQAISHAELSQALAGVLAQKLALRAATRQPVESQVQEPAGQAASIRVDSARLDRLVNLVGELVIVQSRLSQAAQGSQLPTLRAISEDLSRLTAEMRDHTLGIRMIPIGSIYGTLRRLVRDLCAGMGKSAAFYGLGAQTELDKNVIDQLKDPLVHILRNSIDHGIESPAERAAQGKPEKGSITLDAQHSGGGIVITIADDGKGINPARIREKALEKGLLSPVDQPSDKELIQLIFAPGFSTAAQVTNVSGRGVGMDVVKKNIESLRGTVDIDTTPGRGTTLTVRLPLTLAIIDGLRVRVGPEHFVLPLQEIEACQERFLPEPPPRVGSVEYRGAMAPCLSLRKLLEVPGEQPSYERVIMARVEGELVGLAVDQVVGQQQTVIKPLSEVFQGVRFVAGTTVSGDGGVAVILDVPNLVAYAQSGEGTR